MKFEIVWPEHRFVSEAQIRAWYRDAVANCEAEEDDLNDPEEMARELSSIGHITLGRGRIGSRGARQQTEVECTDENIYGLASMQQSVEEDRKRNR